MSKRVFVPLLLICLLSACARSPLLGPGALHLPVRVELTDVPFFPQDDYQCGPAALATVLVNEGVPTTPGALKDKVFLPGRQGSLQVELVAAARAQGQLVYPLEPRLDAVLEEVAAGNPVLVMQNLAFERWPQWHFAVIVGYDHEQQSLVLRSGTTRQLQTSFVSFMRTWHRAGRWAVVTAPPERVPATAQLLPWLQAASDLEETGQRSAARRAYRTAIQTWPQEALPWFALGNEAYARGDRPAAEHALLRGIEVQPAFAPGWFNLSEVLAERGCMQAARQARNCASLLAPEDARFAAPLQGEIGGEVCAALPKCPEINNLRL